MITFAKERIYQIVDNQPEDSSYDEIIRELIFAKIIEKGLKDSDNNNVTSHEEMKNEIETWLK